MKRIIILCDGTNQSACRGQESVSTNVNRFGHALSNRAPCQQLVFYQSGIGTQDLGSWSTLTSSALGLGLDDNVLDAYNFLMNNYSPGDEIFVFGFSRGAFTARVLANFVLRVGIFRKPKFTWELKRAWEGYRTKTLDKALETMRNNSERYDKDDPEGPRFRMVNIKVLGCWDTVAAVGMPDYAKNLPWADDYSWLVGDLVKGVEHAFHVLALDEHRYSFTPTLMSLPKDPDNPKEYIAIDLQQAWFPGAHTNVGGGYADQAIANLTLAWMIDLCLPYLDFDPEYISMCIKLDHHPEKIQSKHRENQKVEDGFDRTYLGWSKGKVYDSYKRGQTYTWKYRTPGAYGLAPVSLTNEKIHSSVRERWNTMDPKWRPAALKGFEPTQRSDESWVWRNQGSKGIEIEEEVFSKDESSFQWKLRYDKS